MSKTLMNYCDSLQHIGIPTDCFEKTVDFYLGLGFSAVHENSYDNGTKKVLFLKYGALVLEVYEGDAPKKYGAIDHIAINCPEVDSAYAQAQAENYKIVSEGIESQNYWENGVRYFIIEGPNRERIEFNRIM